jgi:multidrug resistance efflux pump
MSRSPEEEEIQRLTAALAAADARLKHHLVALAAADVHLEAAERERNELWRMVESAKEQLARPAPSIAMLRAALKVKL